MNGQDRINGVDDPVVEIVKSLAILALRILGAGY
jgi:hypothetical protein